MNEIIFYVPFSLNSFLIKRKAIDLFILEHIQAVYKLPFANIKYSYEYYFFKIASFEFSKLTIRSSAPQERQFCLFTWNIYTTYSISLYNCISFS